MKKNFIFLISFAFAWNLFAFNNKLSMHMLSMSYSKPFEKVIPSLDKFNLIFKKSCENSIKAMAKRKVIKVSSKHLKSTLKNCNTPYLDRKKLNIMTMRFVSSQIFSHTAFSGCTTGVSFLLAVANTKEIIRIAKDVYKIKDLNNEMKVFKKTAAKMQEQLCPIYVKAFTDFFVENLPKSKDL